VMALPPEIADLIARGALFVVNHSGGKDSLAMAAVLRDSIPEDQLLVVHAHLGEVEWDGDVSHIEATIGGLPLVVCRNERRGFLQMVEERGMFPSPQQRQCTNDLKRNPIERTIRQFLKASPRYGGLVVNCMDLRAEESLNRAKQQAFRVNAGNSKAGREWYDWLPIDGMSLAEVWETIRAAGQEPHPAYARGMSRLSCRFFIMARTRTCASRPSTAPLCSPATWRWSAAPGAR
jgi:DNA sulfur modification protein DndC